MLNIRKFLEGLRIFPKTTLASDSKGELEVADSDGKLNYHNGSTRSPVVTESHSATLTNKSFDANGTGNTLSNVETADLAAGVLNTDLEAGAALNTQLPSALAVQTFVDNTTGDVQDNLDAHINDTTDAHDASAISNSPSGNLAATDVQGALNELQTDVDTRSVKITALNEGVSLTTAMSSIDFVGPNVTASNVGDAVTVTISAGSGDVAGPASSVDSEVALFNGTTGKIIKSATGTGFAKLTSGVLSTSASVSLTSDVSGVLPLANGGTNKALTAVAGGIVYTDGDSFEITAAGTSGQVLQSNGTSAPTWVAPPATSDTVSSQTTNFTAAFSTIYLTTNAINVQLPTPVANGRITIKKRDSSTVTIVRAGSEQIEGVAASYSMADTKESIVLVTDGTNWWII